VSTVVGIVIAVAGGFFVVRAITTQWSEVRTSLTHADLGWLAAGVVTAALAMVAVALPWRRSLRLVGVDARLRYTVVWYFLGEIGKYVPGGIWPVVGRGELAWRGGLQRSASYASVVLSLAALYLAGMLVTVALVPLRFVDAGDASALWVLVLLPVGLLLLHHRVLGWLIERAERLSRRELPIRVPAWSSSLGLTARYLPSWFLIGTATWCIARAFDASASWTTIAPAAILSWVVGFVLVPVPGGVGVREAAFVALVGTSIPSGTRATIAIAARLAFMFVDAAGAATAATLWRRTRHGPAPEEIDAVADEAGGP
jgi:uncharacterized membrane protein YbhN (UPF0104 family)